MDEPNIRSLIARLSQLRQRQIELIKEQEELIRELAQIEEQIDSLGAAWDELEKSLKPR